MPFEITMDFTQIEPNITIVDNTHAIEYVALGTEDILKLDDLEVMVMATNKQTKCRRLLQKVLPIIVQEDPYMIRLLGRHKYINIVNLTSIRWLERVGLPFHYYFSFHCVC
jgi:hypothetical protein